jgi:hypothetical protein
MKSFKSFLTEQELQEDSLFEEFLLEAKDDATKEGGVSNNTKGVLHELLVGKHLNGGKHLEKHNNEHNETPQQAHDRLKASIHPKDYAKIQANAKSAAEHIKKHIDSTHPGHKISAVHWTSKAGDTEKVTGVKASQKEDSSDIYVTTKHPKTGKETHHGVSLKVSDKSSKNVPSSSLGMKSSGDQANKLYKEHQAKIKKAHPELEGKNDVARKEWAEKNPQKHAAVKEENKKLLHAVAHHHAAELQRKLVSGDHEHVVNHIRDVLAAKHTPAHKSGKATFVKHTTYQTAKGVQHHVANPGEDHEHILKDHKNITVKSAGGQVHFYHNGKKFASQAHKFDSQSDPLSTIKSAGKAV